MQANCAGESNPQTEGTLHYNQPQGEASVKGTNNAKGTKKANSSKPCNDTEKVSRDRRDDENAQEAERHQEHEMRETDDPIPEGWQLENAVSLLFDLERHPQRKRNHQSGSLKFTTAQEEFFSDTASDKSEELQNEQEWRSALDKENTYSELNEETEPYEPGVPLPPLADPPCRILLDEEECCVPLI